MRTAGGVRWLALLAASVAWTAGCGREATAPAAAPSEIDVQVGFQALWWSPAQMEDLDPNRPPPKETPVALTRWEYSDPVGVPHPDTVDVLASIHNLGTERETGLELRGATRWKVGPLEDEAAAVWRAPEPLPTAAPISLEAGETTEVRIATADVRALQDELGELEQWPWAYGVEVRVVRAGEPAAGAARATATLPILAGD